MIAINIPTLKTFFYIFLMNKAVPWNINRYSCSVGKHDQKKDLWLFFRSSTTNAFILLIVSCKDQQSWFKTHLENACIGLSAGGSYPTIA